MCREFMILQPAQRQNRALRTTINMGDRLAALTTQISRTRKPTPIRITRYGTMVLDIAPIGSVVAFRGPIR